MEKNVKQKIYIHIYLDIYIYKNIFSYMYTYIWASQVVKNSPVNAGDLGDAGSIPGLG